MKNKVEIKNKNLKKAVEHFIETEGITIDKWKIKRLHEIIEKLMTRRKVNMLYEQKGITDLLAASSMLYDVYVVEGSVASFFILRDTIQDILDVYGIASDVQEMLFQMCESFKGEDSPIAQLIPQKGYPDDLFADAVWIYENFGM